MSAEQELSAIAGRVDSGALVEQLLETFRQQMDSYARLPDAEALGQIIEIMRRNIDLCIAIAVDGRDVSEEDLDEFRDSARQRAAEGIPLEDLLHGYRLGGRLGWEGLVEAAGPDEGEGLLLGAGVLMDYIDRVSAAVAQAYLSESQALVSEEDRRLRGLLEALCSTGSLRPALRENASAIGLPLDDHYIPFAQMVASGDVAENARWAASLRLRGVLALTEGNRLAGLAAADAEASTLQAPGALIAVGDVTPREGLAGALDQLRLLVDLAERLGLGGRIEVERLLPELLLSGSPEVAEQLRTRVLGPLEEYAQRKGSELLETLETFVESGLDRAESAKRLDVHPNTLDYRLKRISELAGIDLGDPDSLARAVLALKWRSLWPAEGDAPENGI